MHIQSATATLPFRAANNSNKAENTPCQHEPQDPSDNFDGGSWKDAAVTVGKSTLHGAIEGIGWNYLAYLAEAAGGPGVGLAARVGILGVGAAIGVKEDSGFWIDATGSESLGRFMGGVSGLGKNFLYLGTGPLHSAESAVFRGAIMGGLVGLVNTPRQ